MNYDALEKLPESGVPDKLAYVKHDDHDETIHADFSAGPTDHDGDSVVYDKQTEMSSILPLPDQQVREEDAVLGQLSQQIMNSPTTDNEPLSEFSTPNLAIMGFPTFFPDGDGDPTIPAILRDVPFSEKVKHLIKIAKKVKGHWVFPFARHPQFSYWALNITQRKSTLQQACF